MRDHGRLFQNISTVDVIAPNFKRRLSGVTSTIIQLVPHQRSSRTAIAAIGPGLPSTVARIRFRDIVQLWFRPASGRDNRIWHARRNSEMLPGIIMRDVLRMRLKLVFTSASQREHSRWSRFLISRMDGVIATSAKTAAFLKVPAQIIAHGIDTERFRRVPDINSARSAVGMKAETRLIGCFGRIRNQKGTDLFVDALLDILPDHPGWVGVVSGRATSEHVGYLRDLKARIAAKHLSDRILFLGEVADVVPWYQALELYVAPSRTEGFGITPLEAMACGVPVVASDAGAYPEIIVQGETGSVCAANSHEALRTAIESWMDRIENGTVLNEAISQHVRQHFALEREATQLAAFYEQIQLSR
jgi:mannosyltransferase